MKTGYVLNLYYNSVKAQAARIEHMKKTVKAEAGTNWRVLAYGEHICTIGFFAESINGESFSRDLAGARDEEFCYVLFRVESMPAYSVYGDAARWFATELARLILQKSA